MRTRKIVSIFMAMVVLFGCFSITKVAFAATTNQNTENIVGAPSQKTWIFKADKIGTYEIVFTYARPWEQNTSSTQTVTYTVKVSEGNNANTKAVALEKGKETAVILGQTFTVTLEENASTGYSWSYDIKDNGITLINEDTKELTGAPVNREWTFKASKKGTYQIVFTYARSWEKDNTDTKTVVYKIKVSDKKSLASDTVGLVEGKVNRLCKNQSFYISLEENASTGYSWGYKASAKSIKLISDEIINAEGQPITKNWTFEARKSGTYQLVFTYSRPWENDSSKSEVVQYKVLVSDEKTSDDSIVGLVEGSENKLKLGQKFYVELEENASTGYSWDYVIVGNVISISE